MNGKEPNKQSLCFFGIALSFFFVLCTELFRRMASLYPSLFVEGHYHSDLGARLTMPRGNPYSLFLIPITTFFDKLGKSTGSYCIGIYVSFFVVGTVILTYWLLKKLCPQAKTHMLMIGAFICIFVCPIYSTLFGPQNALYGAYDGAVWHNETFIGMRFFSILVLLFFQNNCINYLDKFSLKDFFISCILFTAVNIAKPNFIIAFAPAMLVMMIIDIIKARGHGIGKWILYGLPVIIGSVVLIYQYFNLFPNDASSDSSHVVFVFGDTIKNSKYPLIDFLRSYAFPLFTFVVYRKEFMKSKFHLVCCLGWLFSFLEYFFLAESGARADHGNFSWGIHFFTFLIFCLSIGFWINGYANSSNNKTNTSKTKLSCRIIPFIGNMLMGLHLISGLLYFALVLMGW